MKTYNCLNCNRESPISRQKMNKYCSNPCQLKYQYKQFIEKWLSTGEAKDTRRLKEFLLDRQFGKCNHCGISEHNGKPIVLEIEHKDGNSSNNRSDNLEMICPNCHSQTATYKSKNRGNGRHTRRLRYSLGKSS